MASWTVETPHFRAFARCVRAATRVAIHSSQYRCVNRSAAADRVHDFDTVAVAQDVRGLRTARHDFAIDLDSDAPLRMARLFEQLGEREARVDSVRLAVEEDVHARIVVALRRCVLLLKSAAKDGRSWIFLESRD
jgi:hypothetical protein